VSCPASVAVRLTADERLGCALFAFVLATLVGWRNLPKPLDGEFNPRCGMRLGRLAAVKASGRPQYAKR
jgi:hypothetical protein